MLAVVWVPILLQLLLPLGLLGWLAFGRPPSRTAWLLTASLVGAYLVAIGVAGFWLVLPWCTPLLYGALLLVALARSARWARKQDMRPRGGRQWAGTLARAGLAAAFAGVALYALSGHRSPTDAVELAFPLRGGPYLVVNGGGNQLINAHHATLEGERFRPWRGQSYGVDLVKLDAYGRRAPGLLPADPAAYAIFGEPIYAPCAGAVVAAVDGLPEMIPPHMDRQHMAGNHVILNCGTLWVVLAHLQRGSVRVRTGDQVAVGQPLGHAGNTGNTGEPHLHIHVQRPGTPAAPLGGEPLPLRFGARYPVRNSRM